MTHQPRRPAAAEDNAAADAVPQAGSTPSFGLAPDNWRRICSAGVPLLEAASLFYLFLPIGLFLAGWLRPVVSLPLGALAAAGVAWAWRQSRRQAQACPAEPGGDAGIEPVPPRILARHGLLIAAAAAFALLATGMGGFSYQFFDYSGYDAMTRDLMEYSRPIAYQECGPEGVPYVKTYYWCYFLPAGTVARFFGWEAGYRFYYVWGLAGVLLMLAWFARLTGSTSPRLVLLFLFFGGLDLLGHLLTAELPGPNGLTWVDYLTGTYAWSTSRGWLEHWSANYALSPAGAHMNGVFFRFYSPLSYLCDGPYHLLPGGVGAMMMLHDLIRRKDASRAVLLWAGMGLAGVFGFAGILPFLGWGLLQTRFRRLLSFGNAAGLCLLVLLILHQATNTGNFVFAPLWQATALRQALPILALYYLAEVLIAAALCLSIPSRIPRSWFLLATAMMLAAPWLRVGQFNDFATKIIIPAQFVYIACIAMALRRPAAAPWSRRQTALTAVALLSALGPAGNVLRGLEFGIADPVPPLSQVRHMNEREPKHLIMQSQANTDAFFWRRLAKQPVYQPSESIPAAYEWNFRQGAYQDSRWSFFNRPAAETPGGMVIQTETNNGLVRLSNAGIAAERAGTLDVDASVTDPQGNPMPFRLVFLWSSPADIALAADPGWPFHRWRSSMAHPREYSLSSNPYWRGPVSEIALYLESVSGKPQPCVVTLRRITLLER